MGIYDRDHRQNDPWKKNEPSELKLKFNEAKGEVELDNDTNASTTVSKNKKHGIYDSSIHRKKTETNVREYNETARTRRKIMDAENLLKKKKFSFSFAPWIIAIVAILIVSKIINKPYSADNVSNSALSTATSITPQIQPVSTLPIATSGRLQTPLTSTLSASYDSASATCPLTLIANNKNYYVKLCDTMRGDKTVAKFFIRAKDELIVKIPAGSYKIKFGSGDEWYGEQELFGQYSQYGEFRKLNFSFDGYSSQGHTISFYKTVVGNLKTNITTRNYIAKD